MLRILPTRQAIGVTVGQLILARVADVANIVCNVELRTRTTRGGVHAAVLTTAKFSIGASPTSLNLYL